MTPQSLEKISKLLKMDAFSAKEARQLGVHPSILSYYCKKGELERLSRGYYRYNKTQESAPLEWQDVVVIAKSIPKGVLCLISALVFHKLTDEFARNIWIAVPRSSRPPKRPNTRVVRFSNMTLGVEKVKLGNTQVSIFDRERTIIDSFRYLSKDIAIKALKLYLKRGTKNKPNIAKITRYAKALRTDLTPYIEAILT